MTAVLAIVDEEAIWMAGDSAAISGMTLNRRKDEKVFQCKEFLIGFTSSFRMGQLLRWKLKPPTCPKGMEAIEYMQSYFIDAVRECLKQGGFLKIEGGVERGGNFIVGYKRELFEVESDFQISQYLDNYAACGCGSDLCLGSLATTANYQIKTIDRLKLGLQAAEKYSSGVSYPFIIRNTKGEKWVINK